LSRPPRSPLFPYTTLFRSRLPSTSTARDRCIAPTRPGARCAIRSSLRSNLPSDAIAGDEVGAWSRRQPPPHALALLAEILKNRRSEEHTSELQSRENLVCR